MSIDLVEGGFSKYHNFYHPEEFFTARPEEGSIHLIDGQRAARASESFINGLHVGVEYDVGEASSLLMYRCGYQWGVQDMKRFAERMRQEYGGGKKDIWNMNKQFVFQCWWWPLTVSGFGGWSLDLSFQEKNITVVEIRNSAVAQSIEMSHKPVCHLYAGLFAGVFSVFDKTEREAIEIQCYAMGNDLCKFLVGEKKQVNAAEFWLKEGATASEIVGNFN